ncbi:hypothetical protein FP2506_01165 [Fulvimarina pelagi HTCC2506]|uniref:Uncharacterized protein n=1 Tax=Fulvimarina pelagi HTCC2506 TaxID=314231 RepID=Q0G264_9HYPH|nr:hypothetical protein [Fulvimarina pelagi]EAU41334.1 hypothetical protein FP2506_01165 [Fulvimarina pelagi HTCC2506]
MSVKISVIAISMATAFCFHTVPASAQATAIVSGCMSPPNAGIFTPCQKSGYKLQDSTGGLFETVELAIQAGIAERVAILRQSTLEKLDAQNAEISALRNEIVVLRGSLSDLYESEMAVIRTQLLEKIARLPIELVSDEEAYRVLKERLISDLGEVLSKR